MCWQDKTRQSENSDNVFRLPFNSKLLIILFAYLNGFGRGQKHDSFHIPHYTAHSPTAILLNHAKMHSIAMHHYICQCVGRDCYLSLTRQLSTKYCVPLREMGLIIKANRHRIAFVFYWWVLHVLFVSHLTALFNLKLKNVGAFVIAELP